MDKSAGLPVPTAGPSRFRLVVCASAGAVAPSLQPAAGRTTRWPASKALLRLLLAGHGRWSGPAVLDWPCREQAGQVLHRTAHKPPGNRGAGTATPTGRTPPGSACGWAGGGACASCRGLGTVVRTRARALVRRHMRPEDPRPPRPASLAYACRTCPPPQRHLRTTRAGTHIPQHCPCWTSPPQGCGRGAGARPWRGGGGRGGTPGLARRAAKVSRAQRVTCTEREFSGRAAPKSRRGRGGCAGSQQQHLSGRYEWGFLLKVAQTLAVAGLLLPGCEFEGRIMSF